MGLGVGVPFASADRRVVTFRGVLEEMNKGQDHCQWIKNFRTICPAHPDQMLLDPFLESVEIDIPKIVGDWDALMEYLPDIKTKAPKVVKNLQFNMDDDGFGECISGGLVTPENAAPMTAHNLRRQNFRSSTITQVLPLPNPSQSSNPGGRQHVAYPVVVQRDISEVEGQRGLSDIELQRNSFLNLHVAGPSSSSQASAYSKHSYHPTRAQLQKHQITFRHGAYGKSYSLDEATAGIGDVVSEELLHSVKAEEAYIRTFCIMMGDLIITPFWMWRTSALMASSYEKTYMPVKWTKLPEVKAIDVTSMDDFWSLFYIMEQAAAHYYTDSYVALLARLCLNLIAGFSIIGGHPGSNVMRMVARKNVIHLLVNYMRVMVNKFVHEV